MNFSRDHFLPGASTVIQHSTQSWNGTLDYDGQETRHGSMIHGNVTSTFTFRATKCLVSPIWVNCPKMYFFVPLVPIIKCSTPDAPRCSMGISIEAVAFGLDKSVIHRIVSLKPELIFIVFRCPGWGLLAFSSNC